MSFFYKNLQNTDTLDSVQFIQVDELIVNDKIDISTALLTGLPVDNTTITFDNNVLAVKTQGITTNFISNNAITPVKLDTINSPNDGDLLTYSSSPPGFSWEPPNEFTSISVNEINNFDNSPAQINITAPIAVDEIIALTPSGLIIEGVSIDSGLVDGVNISQLKTDFDNLDVLTTQGDILTIDASGNYSRLPIGANNEFLASNGTNLIWSTSSSYILPDYPEVLGLADKTSTNIVMTLNSSGITSSEITVNQLDNTGTSIKFADEIEFTTAGKSLIKGSFSKNVAGFVDNNWNEYLSLENGNNKGILSSQGSSLNVDIDIVPKGSGITQIFSDILPGSNQTYDLGSSLLLFERLYVYDLYNDDNNRTLNITGVSSSDNSFISIASGNNLASITAFNPGGNADLLLSTSNSNDHIVLNRTLLPNTSLIDIGDSSNEFRNGYIDDVFLEQIHHDNSCRVLWYNTYTVSPGGSWKYITSSSSQLPWLIIGNSAMYDNFNKRITVNKTGLHLITGYATAPSTVSNGRLGMAFWRNSTGNQIGFTTHSTNGTWNTSINFSKIWNLNAGDNIILSLYSYTGWITYGASFSGVNNTSNISLGVFYLSS